MLGTLVHVKIAQRWAKPNILFVLLELIFNVLGIIGCIYSYEHIESTFTHQILIVVGLFYLFNLLCVFIMYMDTENCIFGVGVEFVIFLIYIVYQLISFFSDKIENTAAGGKPYKMVMVFYFVYNTITAVLFGIIFAGVKFRM